MKWRVVISLVLVLGPLLFVVLYLVAPGFGGDDQLVNGYNLSAVVSALALIGAMVVQRPKPLWPWATIAASLILWVVGDAVWILVGTLPLVSVADALYIPGYLGLIVATLYFVRKRARERDVDSLIDAALIGIAGILAVWELIIEPTWRDPGMSVAGQLMSAAYPVLDVVLLLMLVRLLIAPKRPFAAVLLAVGMGAIFIADMVYAVLAQTDSYGGDVSHLLDATWLVGYALFPIAALHRSMRDLTKDAPQATSRVGSMFVPTAALLSVPAVAITASLMGRDSTTDMLVLSAVTIIPLVVWRLMRLTRSTERARDEVQRRERYFRAVAINSSDAFVVVDADGIVLDASDALTAVLGIESADAIGANGLVSIVDEDREHADAVLQESVARPRQTVSAEVQMRTVSGHLLWVELRCTNLLDDPAVNGIVVNTHDISARKDAERDLEHQAFHDSLTGLANRALLKDRIDHALARRDRDVAVAFCDLDGFKAVNDSFGHAGGDRVLKETAGRLLAAVRFGDTVARVGGDEFAALFEGGADLPGEAVAAGDRMLEAISEQVSIDGAPRAVTASIGVAVASEGGQTTSDELLRDADTAMYRAKVAGRNRVVHYEPSMRAADRNHSELARDLPGVVERGELALQYQPLYELATQRLRGFEALVRWDHPTRGRLGPGEFIAVAEETGTIVEIGAWVLERACRRAQAWRTMAADTRHLTMAVNLSVRQLASLDLIDHVRRALANSGLPPEALVLELTESLLVENPEEVATKLRALKALGLRLAIDDFGVGYSSLSYLRQFPFDILKIDRSFTSTIASEDRVPAIVHGLFGLGRALGLETVAEGIETDVQRRTLTAVGCDLGQGFLFAEPLDEDAATLLVTHVAARAAPRVSSTPSEPPDRDDVRAAALVS